MLALALMLGLSAQQCAVELSLTLRTYEGPIVVEDACLTQHTLQDGRLVMEATDRGDAIFHGDFEL